MTHQFRQCNQVKHVVPDDLHHLHGIFSADIGVVGVGDTGARDIAEARRVTADALL